MAPSGGPRDTTVRTIAQEGATWVGSVAKWFLASITSKSCLAVLLQCGNGLMGYTARTQRADTQTVQSYTFGAGAGGLGAPGPDGPDGAPERTRSWSA